MTLAQLSWVAILFSVIFVLLPAIFTGWGTPPWLWPDWGKIAGLIGVCLWGWMCISCGINLAKRRVSSGRLSGGLGPYAVSMMRGSPPHQRLNFRIQQQAREPANIERLDVSLIFVETIVQVAFDPAAPHFHPALIRDRELWSNTKTSNFKNPSFPAGSIIEVSTEFAIPEYAELHHLRAGEEDKKPAGGHTETTREFHWRVRIETCLTDGDATKALFCLPAIAGEPAVSNTPPAMQSGLP